jgi:hypothetical protein
MISAHLLAQVVLGRDEPGKLEMIERLLPLRFPQPDELRAGLLVEAEVSHDGALDVLPLLGAELAVGVGQLEEQRAGGELDLAGSSGRGLGARGSGADDALPHETTDPFQHGTLRLSWRVTALHGIPLRGRRPAARSLPSNREQLSPTLHRGLTNPDVASGP